VTRSFDGGRVEALRGISLTVESGAYLAVVGPSGSGKSTLIHLLSGLDRPTGGRVLYRGREPSGQGEWARLRAREIGIVFQAFHLLPTLTAAQNVEVPMFGVQKGRAERARKARGLLDRVGMSHRAGHLPGQLSGGERQRVALARSLANSPSLLLADEPTGNLDSRTSREIVALLEEIREAEGTALVIVTHNREVSRGANRVVEIVDGRISGGAG
jgi:putative ABC transport system ATP-binding protein